MIVKIILLILFNLACSIRCNDPHQIVVAVMMVKNEALVICETLQPLVDGGIDSFFIFDTGSTDGTPAVVAAFFEKQGIKNAQVVCEPFIDFATSRNRALALAEQAFPLATFMLMLDAEWYLCHGEQLVDFCWKHQYDSAAAYLIRLRLPDYDFFLHRLIRCGQNVQFKGVVHEYLAVADTVKVPTEIFFEVCQSVLGEEASKNRFVHDAVILRKAYEKNPHDIRSLYFLAQTEANLGNLEEAYQLYRICVEHLRSFDEICHNRSVNAAYDACYASATLAEILSLKNSWYTWALAFDHYLEAFSLWPCRAEPLIKIAAHYWVEKQYELCFLFSCRATELPFPSRVIDPIETELYDFTRYDLLGASAAVIRKYELSEWALRKCLKTQPYNEQIKKNLRIILECKK